MTIELAIEISKNYTTKSDFRNFNPKAYAFFSRKKLLNELTWLEDKRKSDKYSYDTCYNEAKKYETLNDFITKSKGYYGVAEREGWVEDYVWLKRTHKWTYEVCYNEAKKYTTTGDFSNGNRGAYEASRRNNWLDSFSWLKNSRGKNYWCHDTCYEAALKCKSKSEFQKQYPSAYTSAIRNKWLSEYTWLEEKRKLLWTYEDCYNEAKKHTTAKDFRDASRSAYQKARKMGWLKAYTWFPKRPVSTKNEYLVYAYLDNVDKNVYVGLTTKKRLSSRDKEHRCGQNINGIKKYDNVYKFFKLLGKPIPELAILKDNLYSNEAQYYEGYYVLYYKQNGWNVINKAKCGSLGAVPVWTEDSCYEVAKKYETLSEFSKENGSCYETARRNGWLGNYTWLTRQCVKKNTWTYDICYEIAKTCNTRGELCVKRRGAYIAAYKHGWLSDYTWFTK